VIALSYGQKLYKWEHLRLIFLSFLTQVEGFFHLETLASSSSHGSNFTKDSYDSSSSSDEDMIEQKFANMDRYIEVICFCNCKYCC
jgi:hypothetical protein